MRVLQNLIVFCALCVLHIHAELTAPDVKLENSDESGKSEESINSYNDGNQNFQQNFNTNGYQFSGFGNGQNTVVNNGGQSSSVYSSNGNNIIVNRRMGSNNEEETYISVSKPNIRIDGDYCKSLL